MGQSPSAAGARFISGDIDRVGLIDPSKEPYRTTFENAGMTVLDLTKIKTEDGMHHGKFADSPQIVQLIGRRLIKGQTLSGSDVGFLQGTAAVVAGTTEALETAAEDVVVAPMNADDGDGDPAPDKELKGILSDGADPL